MRGRTRHPISALEGVLREAEQKGWTVRKGKKYFKMYCPCRNKHLKTVHLAPSDPTYERNLRGVLRRDTCWAESGGAGTWTATE